MKPFDCILWKLQLNSSKKCLFSVAIEADNKAAVELLLKRGTNPCKPLNDSPLFTALNGGNVDYLNLLLASTDFDINDPELVSLILAL